MTRSWCAKGTSALVAAVVMIGLTPLAAAAESSKPVRLVYSTPGKDHEFWIRRGAENMEKVFLFFSTVSKRTSKGFITPEKIQ